jgi:hypothetical protein
MTYSDSQKRATYNYRKKVQATAAFKTKVREYNRKNYASIVENPTKLAKVNDKARLQRYYSADIVRDIRRLFV